MANCAQDAAGRQHKVVGPLQALAQCADPRALVDPVFLPLWHCSPAKNTRKPSRPHQPDIPDTIQQLGRQLLLVAGLLRLPNLRVMGFPARCLAIVRRNKPRPTLSSRAVARQVAPESTLSTMRAYFEGWSILGILQPKYSVGAATGQQTACSYEPEGQQRCRPSFLLRTAGGAVFSRVFSAFCFFFSGFRLWFSDFGSRGSNSLDSSSIFIRSSFQRSNYEQTFTQISILGGAIRSRLLPR